MLLNFHQFIVEQYMRLQIRNEHVVIAFSTTPYRIAEMQDTVSTILQQDMKPDAIFLAVPHVFKRDNTPYVIPAWLQNHPQITVIRTQDYGPATKLLGVLEQVKLDPNTIIITMDDDVKYPKNIVTQLVYKAKQYPNEAIGIAGADLDYDERGNLISNKIGGLVALAHSDANATLLQGFSGIAYRRNFFNQDIFAITNAPRECINSDDLYLSFHLAKQNIPRRILKNRYINRLTINYSDEIGNRDDALHNLTPSPSDKHRSCIAYMKGLAPDVTF